MKSVGTMISGIRISAPSMASALLSGGGSAGALRLQGGELGVDLLGIAQLGNLLLERLAGAAEAERVGAALREVGAALQDVEARERLVDLGPGIHFAQLDPVLG